MYNKSMSRIFGLQNVFLTALLVGPRAPPASGLGAGGSPASGTPAAAWALQARGGSQPAIMYIYIYVHTYIHMHMNIHIYIYVCVFVYIYAFVCTCICTCVYIYIYAYMFFCKYICIYIYMHSHTITLTYRSRQLPTSFFEVDRRNMILQPYSEYGTTLLVILKASAVLGSPGTHNLDSGPLFMK